MQPDSLSPNKPSLFGGKRQLKEDLEHITQEMYRRNKELAETNKTMSLLRAIDGIVLETHDNLDTACEKIADTIAQAAEYPFVGLLVESVHRAGHLRLAGWSAAGVSQDQSSGLNRAIHVTVSKEWLEAPEEGRIISLDDVPVAAQADALDIAEAKLRLIQQRLNLHSLLAVKLHVRGRLVGVLVSGFYAKADQLAEFDTKLLYALSGGVGVALDNKLLFEENQRVLRELQLTNAKLRELDDIKDDFISMASHQLRTPLTAVKGYLSMMIDGDAGKVTPTQDKMMRQAFSSAQRMVFLITDLLNVSRLKTGKFVIDAAPTDLSAVVKDEIEQLTETAAAKGLELRYKKPPKFPVLTLDEVKIRQVIMNFIDNAIYYTPAGGHVTVELIDEPQSIELRVEDDGIGVPKAEQHHLFTKFYRAENARKARPDGTGLGLFMAQKVIIAQGGSVIFSSKENQGSTFGFTFPKAQLTPPAKPQPNKSATE